MKFFNDLVRNSMGVMIPTIISDDLSNVLVIAATPEDFKKIQYLVSNVDVVSVASSTLPRIFYLKNSNAEDVEKVLNKLFTGTTGTLGGTSTFGTTTTAATSSLANRQLGNNMRSMVSSDKATNSIIAMGDAELYANVERLIEKLDIPRKQVYVEALILETGLDRGDIYGVEWFGSGGVGDSVGMVNSGNTGALGSILAPIMGGTAPALSSLPGGFSGGIIGDTITYNGMTFPSMGAFMSAVRSDAGVNIVSNPQILTLDNEEAEVFVGENRPYVTSEKYDANNNPIQTFDYRNVGVRLKVVPHISGDNSVNLEIDQEVNKISPATFSADSPVTLTRTTKTRVQLYDRSIMVVSGLMKDDSSSTMTGIPILSKIPLLGWLFKSQELTSEKTNLTVFITAHIIHTQDDFDRILQRKTKGTSLFNEKVNDMIWDDLSEDPDRSFVPMSRDADVEMHGIGTE
jgi:general secretion pathway protein D